MFGFVYLFSAAFVGAQPPSIRCPGISETGAPQLQLTLNDVENLGKAFASINEKLKKKPQKVPNECENASEAFLRGFRAGAEGLAPDSTPENYKSCFSMSLGRSATQRPNESRLKDDYRRVLRVSESQNAGNSDSEKRCFGLGFKRFREAALQEISDSDSMIYGTCQIFDAFGKQAARESMSPNNNGRICNELNQAFSRAISNSVPLNKVFAVAKSATVGAIEGDGASIDDFDLSREERDRFRQPFRDKLTGGMAPLVLCAHEGFLKQLSTPPQSRTDSSGRDKAVKEEPIPSGEATTIVGPASP
jgi:hypothetical protein